MRKAIRIPGLAASMAFMPALPAEEAGILDQFEGGLQLVKFGLEAAY